MLYEGHTDCLWSFALANMFTSLYLRNPSRSQAIIARRVLLEGVEASRNL